MIHKEEIIGSGLILCKPLSTIVSNINRISHLTQSHLDQAGQAGIVFNVEYVDGCRLSHTLLPYPIRNHHDQEEQAKTVDCP